MPEGHGGIGVIDGAGGEQGRQVHVRKGVGLVAAHRGQRLGGEQVGSRPFQALAMQVLAQRGDGGGTICLHRTDGGHQGLKARIADPGGGDLADPRADRRAGVAAARALMVRDLVQRKIGAGRVGSPLGGIGCGKEIGLRRGG